MKIWPMSIWRQLKAPNYFVVVSGWQGDYMSPGVFVGTNNDMRINREEMFGPLACVISVDSYEEALHVVNDTNFGLTAGIVKMTWG